MPRPKYEHLPIGTPSTRMLAILPSFEGDDPIRAILYVADLNKLHESPFRNYEALSYTWGSPSLPLMPCRLNGHDHGITPNLEAILKLLRNRKELEFLWVDALCINQADHVERGQQVQIMKRIYQQARQVRAWLGPEADDSALAIRTLQTIADEYELEDVRRTLQDPDCTAQWIAVACFFERDYWKRVWIRQECIVAKKIVVMCGDLTIDWDAMHFAQAMFSEHAIAYLLYSILYATDTGTGQTFEVGSINDHRRDYQSSRRGIALHNLLRYVKEWHATDPRDRIYGLLGVSSIADHFTIDYALPVNEIFTSAMEALLQTSAGFQMLSHCQMYSRRTHGLPSWVIDFESPSRPEPLPRWGSVSSIYNASALREAVFEIAESGKLLKIRGLVFDVVGDIHRASDFKATIAMAYSVLKSRDREISDLDAMHQICHYLLANTTAFSSVDLTAAFYEHHIQNQSIESLSDHLMAENDDDHNSDEFIARIREITWFRKSFATSAGHVGLSDFACQPGDLVCILFGAPMPFVLRQRDDRYLIVGEAYVHNMMQGEAIQGLERGEYEEREFCIE